MRRGLSDKSFQRIASLLMKRGMPFMWSSPIPQSEKNFGVVTHPGFHTSNDRDIAASYAVGVVNSNFTDEDENEVHYVTDYPVVIQVNMSGAERALDYDADNMVRENLGNQFSAMMSVGLDASMSDDEIEEFVQDYMDSDYGEGDPIYSPYDSVSQNNFGHVGNPIGVASSHPEFFDVFRNWVETGQFPEDFLNSITNQFRYESDVEEDQIVAVWFVKPLADVISDYDNEDDVSAQWPGFTVMSQDEAYGYGTYYEFEEVYSNPGVGSTGESEFHGTTYLRFLQAAPGIPIPRPPTPPYEGE
jgi:hypothetical protein